jgi:hypothetical protein
MYILSHHENTISLSYIWNSYPTLLGLGYTIHISACCIQVCKETWVHSIYSTSIIYAHLIECMDPHLISQCATPVQNHPSHRWHFCFFILRQLVRAPLGNMPFFTAVETLYLSKFCCKLFFGGLMHVSTCTWILGKPILPFMFYVVALWS